MKQLRILFVLGLFALAVGLAGCGASPTPIVIVVTAVPAPPTYTPPPPLPTYTPQPTYTPLPTYTPYPTAAQSPTSTVPPAPTATFTLPPASATPTEPPPPPTPTVPPATPTRTPTFTRTPVPCVVSYATQLHVGGQAKVQNDDSHNVRSQPTTSGRILGVIGNGTIVDVLDGPVCGNAMWWWYVRTAGGTLTGWTAEAGGGVRWLANYTGGPTCVSTSERVSFPAGGTSRMVITTLSAGCSKTYVLRIMAGQRLGLSYTGYPNPGLDSITVTNPGGVVLSGSGAAGTIWYNCTTTGDYRIIVRGDGAVQFNISVPPL